MRLRNTLNYGINILLAALLAVAMLPSETAEVWAAEKDESTQTFRYFRPADSGFVTECEIRVSRLDKSLVVTSVTHRGEIKLTLNSRFDSQHVLQNAVVTIEEGKFAQSAAVRVRNGSARVIREGQQTNELNCPRGVIVTSAPDWTDSFLAVQRYDPQGDMTQEFAGLWIHPTREPLELKIKLTHVGSESVIFHGKNQTLEQYLLVLRGGSQYAVWANDQGLLVRLVPRNNPLGGIVLSGWENATRDLKPRMSRD